MYLVLISGEGQCVLNFEKTGPKSTCPQLYDLNYVITYVENI